MLVSSIGYFDALKTMNNNAVSKNQSIRASYEGFGNINDVKIVKKGTWVQSFMDNCKSLFSTDKSDESRKYLSMIG